MCSLLLIRVYVSVIFVYLYLCLYLLIFENIFTIIIITHERSFIKTLSYPNLRFNIHLNYTRWRNLVTLSYWSVEMPAQ